MLGSAAVTEESSVAIEDGKVVSIELPMTVEMKVVETEPAIKGATAQAQLKPATTETGLIVQVPSFELWLW